MGDSLPIRTANHLPLRETVPRKGAVSRLAHLQAVEHVEERCRRSASRIEVGVEAAAVVAEVQRFLGKANGTPV